MTIFVVDASVVVKWFVPEVHSAEAHRLLMPENELVAPDLLFAELANVMWMKVRRGDLSSDEAQRLMRELSTLAVVTVSCQTLAAEAYAVATATGRSAYDAMYVALAVRLRTRMITADARLVNALKASPRFAPHITFIADT
jgi:predicted nucleic acid-binding protein